MANRKHISQIIIALLFISIYILILTLHLRRNVLVDDAFITYRYIANFIEGKGLVYNEGEVVLGTTTPGYALLLSPFGFLAGRAQLPVISLAANFIATIFLMLFVSLIAYKLSKKSFLVALLSPLLVLGSFATLNVMVSGMEGSVFLALTAASLCFIVYRRWLIASITAGLIIWIRPEAAFLMGLIGLTLLAMTITKQVSWKKFVACSVSLAIPSIIYLIMLLIVYDTFLPQSILSKSAGLYIGSPFGQVNLVLQNIISPFIIITHLFFGENNPVISNPTIFIAIIPIALFFIVIGSIQIVKLDRILWIIPALLLIYIIFYGSRTTLLFPWYHANYHIYILLLMTLGFGQIIYNISKSISSNHALTASVIASVAIICGSSIIAMPFQRYLQEPGQEHFVSKRVVGYYHLLQNIGNDIPADAVIALPEIGYLGFYLPDNKILDMAGLVSPEIVDYFPIPLDERGDDPFNGAISKDAIFDFQPEIIISLSYFSEDGLLMATWFEDLYSITYTLPVEQGINNVPMNLDVIVRRDRLDTIAIDPDN